MTVGFRNSAGVDFDSLFAVYTSGTKVVCGYRDSTGSDLSNRYQPGNAGITTGFRNSAGTDLGNLFAALSGGGWTASVSPNPATGSRFNTGTISNTLTIGSTGHVGPLTYSTTWLAGGTGLSISNGTTSAPTISGNVASSHTGDIERTGTARVVVTDTGAGSATRTIDVPVDYLWLGTG
jgi:hypothetical protein